MTHKKTTIKDFNEHRLVKIFGYEAKFNSDLVQFFDDKGECLESTTYARWAFEASQRIIKGLEIQEIDFFLAHVVQVVDHEEHNIVTIDEAVEMHGGSEGMGRYNRDKINLVASYAKQDTNNEWRDYFICEIDGIRYYPIQHLYWQTPDFIDGLLKNHITLKGE